jgi:2-dehydro-3-deoxyphosphogluconate aldolase/(4S)-4-hydroxy-2-oxoglutarate aldolase
MHNFITQFNASPIIPVLTFNDPQQALRSTEILLKKGLSTLEITMRTPQALACIEAVIRAFPEATVGAGTLTQKEQFVTVKALGCSFAVSPGFTKEMVDAAVEAGIPYLPGVSTPSEIMALSSLGISFQKFFHAGNAGGVEMLKVYHALFPDILFCPTGGISEEDYQNYLSLENVLCVGGSWMAKGL